MILPAGFDMHKWGRGDVTPVTRQKGSQKPNSASQKDTEPKVYTKKDSDVILNLNQNKTMSYTPTKLIEAEPNAVITSSQPDISASKLSDNIPNLSDPMKPKSPSGMKAVWSSLLTGLGLATPPPPPPTPTCPVVPPGLQGRLLLHLLAPRSPTLVPGVAEGGESLPANCSARHQVALIVPYRSREEQLAVFLRTLHPLLRCCLRSSPVPRRQQLHYRIYVVNQTDNHTFNRAMLMNVGFAEAMKDRNWSCAVFHDVDLLPEDDRNIYSCPDQPRHMSVAVDKFKYKLPYKGIFGGATAVMADQFR